jgi:hypothetical protein
MLNSLNCLALTLKKLVSNEPSEMLLMIFILQNLPAWDVMNHDAVSFRSLMILDLLVVRCVGPGRFVALRFQLLIVVLLVERLISMPSLSSFDSRDDGGGFLVGCSVEFLEDSKTRAKV